MKREIKWEMGKGNSFFGNRARGWGNGKWEMGRFGGLVVCRLVVDASCCLAGQALFALLG